MRLQCQVEVVNRSHATMNMRPKKHMKAELALGKGPKDEKDYFIILFSSTIKNGCKYKVKDIKQVLVKFLKEGKATICFEEPPHDLLIKSEVLQLKCFLKLLKGCLSGGNKDKDVPALSSISVISKTKVPTKLIIKSRSEFPTKGLPRTLESLYIVGLSLSNFRNDILRLRHLAILDLSNNDISRLPKDLGLMPCISELYLSNNKLGINPDWKWLFGSMIIKTLKLLDLRSNSISSIPRRIWKLQKLVTFKIDNNALKELPSTVGRMSSLKLLSISDNELRCLPYTIMRCSMESIDMSGNDLCGTSSQQETNKMPNISIRSLVSYCADKILQNNIYYGPDVIPWTLVEDLDESNMCVCGALVDKAAQCISKDICLRDCFKVLVHDKSGNHMINFHYYVCSSKCYRRVSSLC